MNETFPEKTGRKFLNLARETLNAKFSKKQIIIPDSIDFRKSRALFVVLKGLNKNISGFPTATYSIGDAIIRATKKAAFEDIQQKSLEEKEISGITIEISILTEIEKINGNILNNFQPGIDGLMCKFFGYTGILLPQTAKEENLNRIGFLEKLCENAGIPKDYWKKPAISFFKFKSQVFREPKKQSIFQ